MAYATQQDLIDRFGEEELIQVSDPQNMAIDPVKVVKALDDASNRIDTDVAALYTVPVNPPHPALVLLCADIARYYLHSDKANENIRKAYEDALKLLEKIRSGLVPLPGATSNTTTPGAIRYEGSARVFTDELLSDYTG